ncbi:hypothetical protein BN1013_00708 [Candidatus Rubidus massiliensis]|nr:hypothetical protein BN1013_00708 [Candidatus Rubidus massiliensis]
MPYKTYAEQMLSHLEFLHSKGFDVDELHVDDGFVRCHADGDSRGRGELVYKTTTSHLDNGLVGLGTWCRLTGGEQESFQTYGLGPTDDEIIKLSNTQPKNSEIILLLKKLLLEHMAFGLIAVFLENLTT